MESISINQQHSKIVTKVLPVKNFTWLIGVGASAGGVETFKELLLHLPEELKNIAVFIAFPVDKKNSQLLSAAIDANSSMSLKQAKQGEEIQPGIIYYCGPGYELDILENHLQINNFSDYLQSNPIDKLFKSLSVAAGERSIAIVLSGMGTDGEKGIKILKEAGGYVIVQAPPTAMYNSMPNAAINTNCANIVLPPFKMGNAILNAVQMQQVSMRQYHLQNKQVNKKALHQKAMLANKNGVSTCFGPHFFTGDLCSNEDIFSFDTMVKETIFSCYQHTSLIVNSSLIIKEFKGDTSLFNTGLTNLINQHLWSVINDSIKAVVMAAVAKATTTQKVATSCIEMMELYNEFSFKTIIVKPILNKLGSMLFYLIILENLQPAKFELKEVPIADKTRM